MLTADISNQSQRRRIPRSDFQAIPRPTASFSCAPIPQERELAWQLALDLSASLTRPRPGATAGRKKERPPLRAVFSLSVAGSSPSLQKPVSCGSSNSLSSVAEPCLRQNSTGAWAEWWGLGKGSTRNSFVLFDLHLKYIWKAADTLAPNRLPTQMLSTKKLPGIIILSIYQFVTRIWHILSLKIRNNNFPPWLLERDRILLQMLNLHNYQPSTQIPNTKRWCLLPAMGETSVSIVTNTQFQSY